MTYSVCVLTAIFLAAAPPPPAAGPDLRVYLPRSIQVPGEALALGAVCVIRGPDEDLVGKACGVSMGRAPWAKEKIVFDRRTILARLACSGIPAERVRFSGAEQVAIGRRETVVPAARIVSAAEGFLEGNRPGPAGCRWRLTAAPEDLVLSDDAPVRLETRLLEDPPAGHVKVGVTATAGGESAERQVLYRLVYPLRQAVAKADIPAGGAITADNAEVRTLLAERPPQDEWSPPFGLIAVRPIVRGSVIQPGLLRPARPQIVVRRGQSVAMRIEGLHFTVTAVGQVLQDGRPGESIRVQNADTGRIVTAKVNFDGSVEPVFEEAHP